MWSIGSNPASAPSTRRKKGSKCTPANRPCKGPPQQLVQFPDGAAAEAVYVGDELDLVTHPAYYAIDCVPKYN